MKTLSIPSHQSVAIATGVKRGSARPHGRVRHVGGALLIAALSMGSLANVATAQINPAVMPSSGPLTKQTMSRLLLTDIVRAGNRLVAVGARGYVVYSDDNGGSWLRANTPPGLALLNNVYAADANTLWAVGHDAVILKSTDQGKEWTKSYADTKDRRPLMDILFIDAKRGFAVGAYGTFLETTDAGKTWSTRKVIPSTKAAKAPAARGKAADVDDEFGKMPDEDRHLNTITRLADGKLFIAGEAGMLLLSADEGKNWTRVTSPYNGSFFGAVQADDGSVLVLGLRGNVFRSKDAGMKSWQAITTNTTASMMSATKLADGAIVLAGLSGNLLMSRNHGKTFSAVDSGTTKALSAIVPGVANALMVAGDMGAISVPLMAAAASEAKR